MEKGSTTRSASHTPAEAVPSPPPLSPAFRQRTATPPPIERTHWRCNPPQDFTMARSRRRATSDASKPSCASRGRRRGAAARRGREARRGGKRLAKPAPPPGWGGGAEKGGGDAWARVTPEDVPPSPALGDGGTAGATAGGAAIAAAATAGSAAAAAVAAASSTPAPSARARARRVGKKSTAACTREADGGTTAAACAWGITTAVHNSGGVERRRGCRLRV